MSLISSLSRLCPTSINYLHVFKVDLVDGWQHFPSYKVTMILDLFILYGICWKGKILYTFLILTLMDVLFLLLWSCWRLMWKFCSLLVWTMEWAKGHPWHAIILPCLLVFPTHIYCTVSNIFKAPIRLLFLSQILSSL